MVILSQDISSVGWLFIDDDDDDESEYDGGVCILFCFIG